MVTKYIYNHEERFISVKRDGQTLASYAYNPDGQRVKKTVNGNTTWYLYNANGLAAEYSSSGQLLKEYHFHPQKTWMTDPLFQRTSSGEVYYYHNDHLGAPQQMLDTLGNIVWSAQYSAFGKAHVLVDTVENNLRFPGQYFDVETGLHQNYFRDYDSVAGRYVQADPLGLVDGPNVYAYARQNPTRYTDPLGLTVWDCTKLDYFIGPFGYILYTCTSECFNGKQTKVRINVNTNGAGFDLGAGIVGSRGNTFNDGRGRGAPPDINIFNGAYFESGGGYTIGIGGSYSAAAFAGVTGGAIGNTSGMTAGFGVGVGSNGGRSEVKWSREKSCSGDC